MIFQGCTCLRSALPLARARSAPTYQGVHLSQVHQPINAPTKQCTNRAHECRLLCWCSWDSCTPWCLFQIGHKSEFCVFCGSWLLHSENFSKKTLEPSAKPHANIVQVSAAKKFILEKWEACFEVFGCESRTKDNKIWGFLVEKHRKTKLFVRLYMVIAMLLHGNSYAFTW